MTATDLRPPPPAPTAPPPRRGRTPRRPPELTGRRPRRPSAAARSARFASPGWSDPAHRRVRLARLRAVSLRAVPGAVRLGDERASRSPGRHRPASVAVVVATGAARPARPARLAHRLRRRSRACRSSASSSSPPTSGGITRDRCRPPRAAPPTPSSAASSRSCSPWSWRCPLAVATAVFLNETRSRLRRPVRIYVDAMSGLPSIVAGLFIFAVAHHPVRREDRPVRLQRLHGQPGARRSS